MGTVDTVSEALMVDDYQGVALLNMLEECGYGKKWRCKVKITHAEAE